MNIWQVLRPTTTFSTVLVNERGDPRQFNGAFFQAFIGVTARHPVIKRYVELFLEYYEGKLPEYKGKYRGVVLLRRAFDDCNMTADGNDSENELWQEMLYNRDWNNTYLADVRWRGGNKLCNYIVVSGTRNVTTNDTNSSSPRFVVPFYSRIC
jgi:hypothetical protein